MAVAHDAASESHTGTTGHSGSGSFGWTHTPSGTPRGVLVGVLTIAAAPLDTSVTYGGVELYRVLPFGNDTLTEPGSVVLYFRGEGIPTGAQTVTVNRTNNATVMYAVAATVTAGADTECGGRYFVIQENSSWIEEPVDDGSPGTDSMRYAFGYSGAGPIAVGANSTSLNSINFGSFSAMFCRETTAGQGSRSVGFNSAGGSDDNATVHVAIRERPSTGVWHSMASKSGTAVNSSVASFSWTHPESRTPTGVQVHVTTNPVAGAAVDTAVTYGGVAMTLNTSLTAADTGGEPGFTRVWELYSGIPAGPQTVVVTRTNDASACFATCVSQYASGPCETYTAGAVLLQQDGVVTEQSPDDGSPGSASIRYVAAQHGGTANTVGTHTVQFVVQNMTLRDYRMGWEIIGGQGARPVGFDSAGGSDDRAFTHYAVRLAPVTSHPFTQAVVMM